MKYQKIIDTARLTLRPFTGQDAPRVAELAGDRRIYKMTLNIPHPYAPDVAATWINGHEMKFNENNAAIFAVTLQNGLLIGAVGLEPRRADNTVELGYWIGAPYWGRGYCTEAARAVLHYAFNELGFLRVTARHFDCNPASGRVMEKIGMRHAGDTRDGACKDGVYHDWVHYAISAGEFYGTGRTGDQTADPVLATNDETIREGVLHE